MILWDNFKQGLLIWLVESNLSESYLREKVYFFNQLVKKEITNQLGLFSSRSKVSNYNF